MARLDDSDLYNPFGWRLAELADSTTTERERSRLREELLMWEAEELAHGRRHLTVVHGAPDDRDADRQLSRFYATLARLAAACAWARVRGTAEFVTVTVAGPDADAHIGLFAQAAHAASSDGWTIVDKAYPPLT